MNKNTTSKNAARDAGQLTEKQLQVLATIAQVSQHLPDNHVERKSVKFSPDVFNALKRKELVNAHGKYVWLTKKGIKAIPVTVPPPAVQPVELPAEKKPARSKGKSELNWAYRRLRRQAYLYFSQGLKRDGLVTNLEQLRKDLDEVPESYNALQAEVERLTENDNKLTGTWASFMESFFNHVIHPGSQSK